MTRRLEGRPGVHAIRLYGCHAVDVLQDAVHQQKRRAGDRRLIARVEIGATITLAIPVSSSSVRNTNPFAVPGRCRVMTIPAVRTRWPVRPRGKSIAR